jgi:hypothetical protein
MMPLKRHRPRRAGLFVLRDVRRLVRDKRRRRLRIGEHNSMLDGDRLRAKRRQIPRHAGVRVDISSITSQGRSPPRNGLGG